jgi:hypothetical protein
MELYTLRKGDRFRISSSTDYVPKGDPEPDTSIIYRHEKVDGMYSINLSPSGEVVHLAAWTDVEVIE